MVLPADPLATNPPSSSEKIFYFNQESSPRILIQQSPHAHRRFVRADQLPVAQQQAKEFIPLDKPGPGMFFQRTALDVNQLDLWHNSFSVNAKHSAQSRTNAQPKWFFNRTSI
jgi:hypothetical protein